MPLTGWYIAERDKKLSHLRRALYTLQHKGAYVTGTLRYHLRADGRIGLTRFRFDFRYDTFRLH